MNTTQQFCCQEAGRNWGWGSAGVPLHMRTICSIKHRGLPLWYPSIIIVVAGKTNTSNLPRRTKTNQTNTTMFNTNNHMHADRQTDKQEQLKEDWKMARNVSGWHLIFSRIFADRQRLAVLLSVHFQLNSPRTFRVPFGTSRLPRPGSGEWPQGFPEICRPHQRRDLFFRADFLEFPRHYPSYQGRRMYVCSMWMKIARSSR